VTAEHRPAPSTYDCRACHEAWPCEPARQYLITTTPDRLQLLWRMASELEAASLVLDAPDLWHRFVGWARRARRK
jgi:hypothetical protein